MSTPLQPECLKDEAADMATTSRQPKRRKDIVQRYETGGKPTSGEQQNRRKLTVQRGTGETSGAGVNMLCTTCKHLFAYAKDRARRFSWYYDILGLMDSAGKGCHFCVQVLRNIDLADVESLKREFAEPNVEPSKSAEKRLKAETRYYTHMGVAFILRRSGAGQRDYLAHLALYFAQGISKYKPLHSTRKFSI
jgi:hypothetical protein